MAVGAFEEFLVCPFARRDRVFRIDTDIWPAPCVDTDPTSCVQRFAFAGKQKTRVIPDPLKLREYLAGYEILAHARDGIGLEAMILRCGRMGHEHRRGDSDG